MKNLKSFILPLVFPLVTLSLMGQQVETPQETSPVTGEDSASGETDRPINPPKVTCAGDSLTISANNSTLVSILEDFRKCSGVQIDAPSTAASPRIFDDLGPGPAHQVLTALLSASGFNYVIEASPSDPDKIETIVLLAVTNDKSPSDIDVRSVSPAHKAYLQMRETARPKPPSAQAAEAGADAETTAADAENSPKAPAENLTVAKSSPPPANGPDSKATEPNPPAAHEAAQDGGSKATVPDSTGQQILSMQQMFEQRKEMMQAPVPSQQQ
jgi:hypothetical protein